MTRPQNAFGYRVSYPPTMTAQDIYDADDLPPLTQALRDAWGPSPHPVPSAAAMAAILAAVHDLETRLAALENR